MQKCNKGLSQPLSLTSFDSSPAREPFGTVQTRRTVPYPFAERSFQWGYGGCWGGLRGEIEIFPGPPAKKVIRKLLSLLFISTPKSIAKPSPGWNKVALLTFVRNSPCSCPFSVSLTRPQDALNSEPRERWRLLVRNAQPLNTQQKSTCISRCFSLVHPQGLEPWTP